jgi:uncharacterized protein (TIGR02246 family)
MRRRAAAGIISDMTEHIQHKTDSKTETAAEEFFRLFVDTWKTNDGAGVASLFTDDGALINPFGQRADGRAAIDAMYSEYFAGMLAGTTTTFDLESVRAVETNHAFADGVQTIYGAGGDVILVAHLAALLRRDSDDWRFVDSRPYTIPTIPG